MRYSGSSDARAAGIDSRSGTSVPAAHDTRPSGRTTRMARRTSERVTGCAGGGVERIGRITMHELPPPGRSESSRGACERAPWLAASIAAGTAAALVGAFPDRLHYVGDFMLRIGAVRQQQRPDVLSPQAFPLDVLVHYAAPLQVDRVGWLGADAAVRV